MLNTIQAVLNSRGGYVNVFVKTGDPSAWGEFLLTSADEIGAVLERGDGRVICCPWNIIQSLHFFASANP